MSYKPINKAAALILPLLLLSCNVKNHPVPGDEQVKILFAVDRFESAATTRTIVSDITTGTIHWVLGDTIGVFPYEGFQEPFAIPEEQINQVDAEFDGGYWALKEGFEYNAYYPFDLANFASADMKKQIPVSYLGQTQYGTAINTGNYDFTYSDWKQAPAEGSVTFNFHHIGAFAVFNVIYPVDATYTRLALSTTSGGGNNLIPVEGTYDLTYSYGKEPAAGSSYVKIPYVPTESAKAARIEMSIFNAEGTAGVVGESGEQSTFYMMLPPMDLSGEGVVTSFEIYDGTNTYSCAINPTNFQSGKKYTFTLTPMVNPNADIDINAGIGNWYEESGSGTATPDFE